MVRRKNPNDERYIPGTTFIIHIPLRFSVSAPLKFHEEVRNYFKNIKSVKCEKCTRIITKESFGDVIKRSILKDVGVLNIDDLRTFPNYNSLFKESASKFWDNLPLKNQGFIISPSAYARQAWDKFKLKNN